jgi:branched-chain amino acid transport system substrate-binding protein
MTRSRIGHRAALLIGAGGILAACGSGGGAASSGGGSTSAANAGPYRVLAILSETGTSAAFGSGAHAALQYTADQLNKQGGIMGRQIVIDFQDDQGDAVRGTSLLNRALATTHYDLIDAGTVSDTNIALRPALGQANILAMTTSGGIDVDVNKDPTLFVVSPEVTASSAATVSYVVNTLKSKRVALLTVNNST